MNFRRLRLIGFKSFVDPTDLIIEPGLTGVIGPNGCGKSNLTEALRWVMGETSAKSLRGGGMEDVIFSGTDRRPARSFAEVSLFIDNEDRTAPADFNSFDQLDIIRRITRNTGSAYKVNGKDHRARDVQTLFADAATGAHSPSLVRQGQIGELINAKPKNRRRILEDAAGIAGLYTRRHEAELKLNATEDNLTRLEDTLKQLESQLATLERQSKQAARYREVSQDLRRTELLVLYVIWQEATQADTDMQAKVRAAMQAAAQAAAVVVQKETARDAADTALPALREEESIAGAILQRTQLEQEALQTQLQQAEHAITSAQSQVSQYEKDIDRETTLNADAQRMLDQLLAEDARIAQEQTGESQAIETAQAQVSAHAKTMEATETAVEDANMALAKVQADYTSLERDQQTQATALHKAKQDAANAQTAIDTLQTTLKACKTTFDTTQTALTEATQHAHASTHAVTQTEAAQLDASEAERTARHALTELETEHRTLQTEEKSLLKLIAQATAQTSKDAVLKDITVKPGYENALGAVLGAQLAYPVVSDTATVGWFADTQTDKQTMAQPLLDFVTAPPALHRALQHIGIIEGQPTPAQCAALQTGQVFVNAAGDIWRWDGLHLNADKTASSTAMQLQHKNRLTALQGTLATLKTTLESHQQTYATAKTQADTAKQAYQTARTQSKRADEHLAHASRAVSKAESDMNAQQARSAVLTETLDQRTQEATATQALLTQTQTALQALPALDDKKDALQTLKQTLSTQRQAHSTARTDVDAQQRRAHGRKKRRESIATEAKSWRNRLDTAETRLTDVQTRLAKAQQILSEAKQKPADLHTRQTDLDAQKHATQQRLDAACNQRQTAETTLSDAEQALRHAQDTLATARETRVALETKAEACEAKTQEALDRLSAQSPHPVEDILRELAVTYAEIAPLATLEQSVVDLRRTRERLGAVNLRADEEAQEIRAEFEKLTAEKEDLTLSVEKLRGGIARLNREGRQRLLSAFDSVNKNFSALFKHLFNGGEAHLQLIEADDPLEAGLEIMCMPPGKKLASLSLLSGGEQTLTALSLIFAVFLANPSPICVLDEVDAPLDDANVNRFCDLLEEMTRRTKTRFLIITHHATTMSRMDRLFGVTMQEQGVSQLVSVDLGTATQMVS